MQLHELNSRARIVNRKAHQIALPSSGYLKKIKTKTTKRSILVDIVLFQIVVILENEWSVHLLDNYLLVGVQHR